MAMIWYPENTGGLELYVDNPGYGELLVIHNDTTEPSCGSADSYDGEGGGRWQRLWTGGQLGRFLAQVTVLALTGQRPAVRETLLPARFGRVEAGHGLAAVQAAVLLAAAGTERWERLHPEPDEAPAEPLCARCNHGTPYASAETVSGWCAEHGHTPFGQPWPTSWEQAQQRHADQLRWWHVMHRTEAETPTGHAPGPADSADGPATDAGTTEVGAQR